MNIDGTSTNGSRFSPVAARIGSSSAEENGPRFSFVMIVLNGMPFIEYSLKSVYDFAHEIIIIEGAVENCMFAANADGSSTDGTVEFIESFPDPQNKVKLVRGRWPEKCEMQNEALRYVTGDYVWLIDSDEVYKREDLEKIKEILKGDPSITQVNFIQDSFWKGLDYIFVSSKFFEDSYHSRRIFKYVPGSVFTTHRPPTLVWPGSNRTTEQINLLDGTAVRAMGITFYHYSYVLDEQVKQKIQLYDRYGWGRQWNLDLGRWYEECFLRWTPQNREQIDSDYPIWTGDIGSHTVLFNGTHPKVVIDYILNDAASSANRAAMRHVVNAVDEIKRSFPRQQINAIETGTIRSFHEKHFSTYHISCALGNRASLISVDISADSIRISRQVCHGSRNVEFVHSDSIKYLKALKDIRFHFALLDSVNDKNHILEEFRLIVPMMVEGGILIVDDAGITRDGCRIDTSIAAQKGHLIWEFLRTCGVRPAVLETTFGHGTQLKIVMTRENLAKIERGLGSINRQTEGLSSISGLGDGAMSRSLVGNTRKSIVWVRTDSIGDAVLSASMLPHISEKYEDARIAVVCEEHIAELYEACPYVDDIVAFDKKRALQDERYREEIVMRLRALKPDVSLNSVYSREALTDWFAIKCGAEQRIAFNGNLCNISAELRDMYNQFYTDFLPSPGTHKLELERSEDFLRGLGIEAADLQPMIWTTAEDETFAEKFFQDSGLSAGNTIALFPSAQHSWKVYEQYKSVLHDFDGFRFVILGGKDAEGYAGEICSGLPQRCWNLAGRTTIRQMAAIIRRCCLYLGSDSAGAHIACAVGVPSVVVLGGGHFGRFMPYSPLTSVVCLPLECYGCNWGCRYESPHCVKDVAVEVVAEALRQSLAKSSHKIRVFMQGNSLWKPSAGRPAWKTFERFVGMDSIEVIPIEAHSNTISGSGGNLDVHTPGPARLADAECRPDVERPGDAGLTIATSIAPKEIEKQAKAIESWIKLGFEPVSINCAEEIDILRESFPKVRFVPAKRDAREAFGKPFIYFDDFLEYFRKTNCKFCGIVNSDIHLFADEDIVSFIQSQTKDSLVYGYRAEVDSLEDLRGRVCETGFDFFFFDSSLISCFPTSDFCIGKPWWDYWLPTIAALEGFSIKQLISPFAYHIKHLCEWGTEEWGALAKKFFGYLHEKIEVNFYSHPDNNPWVLLGRMFSTYHHQYLKEKGIGDENKMSMEIIVPCILGFLETQTLRITYANNTSADSQNAFRPSKKKREVAQQNEVIQQKETAQNVERQMDFEAQRNSKLTIATSIAPKKLKKQAKAIESWAKLGFDVVSLNCREEIDILQESFPDVKFVQAKRDARNTFGKPVIYLDDFFEYFCQADSEFCGIVNSDIFLIGDEGVIPFIQSQARNALVYGSRIEIDSLEVLCGEVFEDGFDFFFFHRSLISCFPKSDFCIGIPWWDYWVPLISALEKVQIKKFITPFAYHIKHSFNWDMEQWVYLAQKCLKYLLRRINENFNENPDNNPWAFLGNIFSTYHNQDVGGCGTKHKMSPDVFCRCLLDFLEKKTLQITYADNKSTDSRNVSALAKKKEDIFIHKGDSRTQKSDCLSAEYDVGIIICTNGRAELLDQMLTSLKEAARGVVYELIVVEGGSRDNTLDVLRKHNVKKVYSESEWLGPGRHSWPQLYNFGFSMTNVKWAMYASDDIVFAKGCISKAVRLLNKQRDEVAGGIFFYKNTYQTRPEWDKLGIDFTYGPRLLMNYGLVRLDHFREVGGLDEAYQFYCADSDLCCKLHEKGKQLIPLPESFVAHNNVLDAQKRANADTSGCDIQLFQERWKHLIPTEIPRSRRLFWQEEFFEAFNLPADLERIDSGIESFWYGLACFQEGFFEEAKSRFMQVVKSFCDHDQVLWYLARAADKCGDKAMAEKAATAVVKLAPDFEPALELLLRVTGRRQYLPAPVLCSAGSGAVNTVNSYADEPGPVRFHLDGQGWGRGESANQASPIAIMTSAPGRSGPDRCEMELRREIGRFNKVVVWGLKTSSHTHAHIHRHFFDALTKVGAKAAFVDDSVESIDVLERNDLVIAVDVASSHLPIAEGVYYCLHNCPDDIHRRIAPARNIRLQTYTSLAEPASGGAEKWDEVTFFDSARRALFQPWATDLLASEFEEPILHRSGGIVFWVGSIWDDGLGRGNVNEIQTLKDVLEARDIRFVHLQGISDSLNVRYVRNSLIAPAIVGRWQMEHNYLPCRMWKNISYGQLGVSNARKFDEVFGDCTVKGRSIEEIIDNTLSLPFSTYRDMICRQQEIVKSRHTYVNRLLNIIRAFESIENH